MPEIERIAAPPPDVLWRDHVLPRKPVILTDLIADFPFRTVEAIAGEFADEALTDASDAPLATLAQWWRAVQGAATGDPASRAHLATLEQALASTGYSKRHTSVDLRVPANFFAQAGALHAFHAALQTPTDRTMHERGQGAGGSSTLMMFLGHPGVITPLHVDGWVAQTLNVQLAGKKEWFLAPPEASAALGPYGFTFLVDPMRMAPRERASFAEAVGGYSFTVEAGETLYFPHQWVHGTYYPEPSFSFVHHFGRDLFSMFVSREVRRGFLRHAVMQQLYPQQAVEQRYWAEFVELHDACKRAYATPAERFAAIEGVLRVLFEKLYPERPLAALPFDVELVRALDEERGLAWYRESGYLEGARAAWQKSTGQPLFDWWT